jgi:hypothetical protein
MRVVTTPVASGNPNEVQFWALRFSENYGNIGGAYTTYAVQPNGWVAAMIPPEARANAWGWIDSTGAKYADNYALAATHQDLGPGYTTNNYTAVIGGNNGTGIDYGVRWNQLFASQVGNLATYDLYGNGRFGGVDLGGGSMESYNSMRQIAASANEKRWSLDLRHMSPFGGIGQENYAGVGTIAATLVAGTNGVFKFTSYPGSHADIKHYGPRGFAGPYLLQDVSSPATGNVITDATQWAFCFVYVSGECRSGSMVGEIYVSIPNPDLSGVANNSCIAGWYAQVNPCALIPFAMQAWGIQNDLSRQPVDDNYWRKLTMGLSGPGRQYQFGNLIPTPDGSWAFTQGYWLDGGRNEILALKLPPFPNYDSVNRADYVPVPVAIPGGQQASARVRFG